MPSQSLNPKTRLRMLAAAMRIFMLAGLLAFAGCTTLGNRQSQTLTTLGFNKVEDGWKLVLPERVLFRFDDSDLKPDLRRSIADVAHQLLSVEISQVRVEGHTDNVGSREYNQELSLRRANNVAAALVADGFAAANVESKGYGQDRPTNSNATEEGRADNRRVEIIVLSNALSTP